MASGSVWNLWLRLYSRRWVWVKSMSVVVRRYNRFRHIIYLSLLLLYLLFFAASLLFVHF